MNMTTRFARMTVMIGTAATAAPCLVPSIATAESSQRCIAVALPSAEGITEDATSFSNSLRDLLMSYLTGPSLRAVALNARLTSQAVEEARQQGCDHVLLTSVKRERNEGSRWTKALQKAAGPAALYSIPYGSSAAGAAARGAAVGGAYAVSDMAQTAKAKDEVTLEYRIGSPGSVLEAQPQKHSAKAKTDGEDLLTPLVEKAAESVAATVLSQKPPVNEAE
jgi:hypothetical protein